MSGVHAWKQTMLGAPKTKMCVFCCILFSPISSQWPLTHPTHGSVTTCLIVKVSYPNSYRWPREQWSRSLNVYLQESLYGVRSVVCLEIFCGILSGGILLRADIDKRCWSSLAPLCARVSAMAIKGQITPAAPLNCPTVHPPPTTLSPPAALP